jgi:tetratricopeptide (TPR) repeat protein
MFEKTLEYNSKDLDTYKLYTRLLLVVQEFDNAKVIAKRGLEKCGLNGDLYYLLAVAEKQTGNFEGYKENLKKSLKHFKTLTYPVQAVDTELKKLK